MDQAMADPENHVAPRQIHEQGVGFSGDHDGEPDDVKQRRDFRQVPQMVLRLQYSIGGFTAAKQLEIFVAQLPLEHRA
jgi:hypothetical protein